MTEQPKHPAILSDPIAQAWRRGELDGGEVLTPQPMTDTPDTLVTRLRADEQILTRGSEIVGAVWPCNLAAEAADEIDRLTAQSERVVEVLREARTALYAVCECDFGNQCSHCQNGDQLGVRIDALLSSLDGKGF